MKNALIILAGIICCLYISPAQPPNDLTGLKICIDPGHGGFNPCNDRRIDPNPGSGNIFWESEGNFRKALWLKPLLEARGATVFITRTTNDSTTVYPDHPTNCNADPNEPSLSARWQFANANNVHWFHSIHSNATGGTNTSTNYTMVLLKENISTRQPAFPAAVDMSSMIYNNIRAINRTGSSGGNIAGKPGVYLDYTFYGGPSGGYNLGVLSGLIMPGELSEGSFHDYYPETRRLLNNDYRKGEAYGLYNGFVEYYGIPFDTLGIICGTQKSGSTPINNIVVRLLPPNKVYNGDTYNNGYFFFDSLAPGNYKVLFETGGYPLDTVNVVLTATTKSVSSSVPQHTATNVSRSQNIVINFLKPMDTTSVKNAFSILPATSGTFVWNNDRTSLTFTPSAPLLYYANYTVTLAGYGETRQPIVFVDNKTVTSNLSTANFVINFQTEQLPPYLILTQPKEGDTAFAVTKQIGLKFSLSMDTASVRSAISFIPSVSGTFGWSQNNTTLLITPTGGLAYNTNYTVTVSAAAKSIYGASIDANRDSIPGDPFILTFRTQSNPNFVERENGIPAVYSLYQNYPNPFNPQTSIDFSIPQTGFVSLKVYDNLGREVASLVHAIVQAGTYTASWDASAFASGIYFYKLSSEKFTDIKRMVLLK
ncbi:MAG: Ig-like domain-containing protein [Bacteroidota bacterium]